MCGALQRLQMYYTLYVRGEGVFELDGDYISSAYGVQLLIQPDGVTVSSDAGSSDHYGTVVVPGKSQFDRVRVLGQATLVIKNDSRLKADCSLGVYVNGKIRAPQRLSQCHDHVMIMETHRSVPLFEDIVGR